jgi:hypothetical protein
MTNVRQEHCLPHWRVDAVKGHGSREHVSETLGAV